MEKYQKQPCFGHHEALTAGASAHSQCAAWWSHDHSACRGRHQGNASPIGCLRTGLHNQFTSRWEGKEKAEGTPSSLVSLPASWMPSPPRARPASPRIRVHLCCCTCPSHHQQAAPVQHSLSWTGAKAAPSDSAVSPPPQPLT